MNAKIKLHEDLGNNGKKLWLVVGEGNDIYSHPIMSYEVIAIRDACNEYLEKFEPSKPSKLTEQFLKEIRKNTQGLYKEQNNGTN